MDFHQAPRDSAGQERWAQEVLARVAFASLREQRRARRWGIFFKSLFFIYILSVTGLALQPMLWDEAVSVSVDGHTALVSLNGVIASGAEASAENIIRGLRAAFADENTRGVLLAINSPGGSPVESSRIYQEMQRLRREHPDTPLYAVVADICASGGYYVAAAAERIYADGASLVGSIGVRAGGFGFTDAMEKLGIERRLYTAGDNKGMLDPFAPEAPSQVQHMEALLENVHQQFIAAVQEGRGDRLAERPELFSGLIWTGAQGIELGLVDGLGSLRSVAEEHIGSTDIVDFSHRGGVLERLLRSTTQALTWHTW